MALILYGQRDPRWSGKELGWGPPGSTIGLYGCDLTCDAMIARNAFPGILGSITPASLDDDYTGARTFRYDSGGDYDLLDDGALHELWPSLFASQTVWGYDATRIAQAVASPNVWVKLWIHTASVPSHFVIAAGGNSIMDPWTASFGTLSGYGGPGAVGKMIFITVLPQAAPAPPPPPPPTYTYTAKSADGAYSKAESSTTDSTALSAAKADADTYAAAHMGVTVNVFNASGANVYSKMVPVPLPVYSVTASDGTVVEKGTTNVATAEAEAQAYADAHPSETVVVKDDKGNVIKSDITPWTYSVVRADNDSVLEPSVADLATAMADADADAKDNPTIVFLVKNQLGAILYSALVPVAATPDNPNPNPPQVLPSTPPPYGAPASVLAALQTILIAIGRFLARERR